MPRSVNPAHIVQLFKSMPNIERKLELQVYYSGTTVKTIGCFIGDFVEVDYKKAAEALFARMKIPNLFSSDWQ